MENGERLAMEALVKILDFYIGTFKGIGHLSVAGFNAIYQHAKETRLVAGENDISKLRNCNEQIGLTKINKGIDIEQFISKCKDSGIPCSVVNLGNDKLIGFRKSDEEFVKHILDDITKERVSDLAKKDINIDIENTKEPVNSVEKNVANKESDKDIDKSSQQVNKNSKDERKVVKVDKNKRDNKNPLGNIRNLVKKAEKRLKEENTPLLDKSKSKTKVKGKAVAINKDR